MTNDEVAQVFVALESVFDESLSGIDAAMDYAFLSGVLLDDPVSLARLDSLADLAFQVDQAKARLREMLTPVLVEIAGQT